METIRSAVPSDVPAVQGGVAVQDAVVVEGGVVVLPQWFDPRRAVHEQDIMCLVCGKCFRQLTNTHLRSHDLTTASYKTRFGVQSPPAPHVPGPAADVHGTARSKRVSRPGSDAAPS